MSYVPLPNDYTGEIAHIGNINAASIVPGKLRKISHKHQPLIPGSWVTLARGTGAGVITKFWMALNSCDPTNTYIQFTFDGSNTPQIGSNIISGHTSADSMAVDVFLTAVFGNTYPWAVDVCGCNVLDATNMGGYIQLDAPFGAGFEIKLLAPSNASNPLFWSQVEYCELATAPTPMRLHASTFVNSSPSNSGILSFNEIPLVNTVAGAAGLRVKTIKMCVKVPTQTSWFEGRIRSYIGGDGMGATAAYTVTTLGAQDTKDANYYQTMYPSAVLTAQSSGLEDEFLGSYNWNTLPTYACNDVGVVFNSATSGANGELTLYRNYRKSGYFANANDRFVLTFTNGDQNRTVASASLMTFVLGYVLYLK